MKIRLPRVHALLMLTLLPAAAALAQTPTITVGPDFGTRTMGPINIPLTATGGTAPYTWSVTAGALPAGLNLRTDLPNPLPGFWPAAASAGIVGVATATGTASFTLTVTDAAAHSTSSACTLKILSLTIIDVNNMPWGFVNSAYSFTPTLSGSSGTVNWTVGSGSSLPPGLSLNAATGAVTGSPTTPGNYNFTLNVSDSNGGIGRNFTINVFASGIGGSGALGNVNLGASVSQSLTPIGGTPSYTYSASGLPSGLTLSSGGLLSGQVTAGNGTYRFNATITDQTGGSYTRQMALNIIGSFPQPLNLNYPTPIDDSTLYERRSYGLNASGGIQPYAWSTTGSLPPGMLLRTTNPTSYLGPVDAEISGVPTATGTYNITVNLTDGSGLTVSQPLTIKVSAIGNDYPPNGTRGVAYNFYLRPLAGTPPFTWTQVAGSLPSGLTLNPATGLISGTPVDNGNWYAMFDITVPMPGGNQTLRRGIGSNIASPTNPQISNGNGPLGDAVVNQFYSAGLGFCCAPAGLTYSVSGAPLGMSINSSTGQLSGTPTTVNTYTITVTATEIGVPSNFGVRVFTLNVTPISVMYNNIPVTIGVPLAGVTLIPSGGTGPYVFTRMPEGQFPPGITLNANGTLTGTPTSSGAFYFRYKVTDSAGKSYTNWATLEVYPAGAFGSPTINVGPDFGTWSVGPQQAQLNAYGGNGTYSWALVNGSLPPGMSLRTDVPSWFASNATAGLIGVATTPGIYHFTLSLTSAGKTAYQYCTVKITGLNFKDKSGMPDAFEGLAYSYQLAPLNNAGTVTWTVDNGVPAGMTLSSTGLLSGTPTTAGNYNINFHMSDGVDTVYFGFGLQVYTVRFTSLARLPNATHNASYSYTLTAAGGTGPYTYAGCCLPNGLSLNTTSGAITGTVTGGQGTWKFNVTATDSQNHSYNQLMALDVLDTPQNQPQLDTYWNPNDCVLGGGCWIGVNVGGGTAPYTYTVTGIPAGMSFRTGAGTTIRWVSPADVEIWGTPTVTGTFNLTVTATDVNGLSGTIVFPLKVAVLSVDTGLPNGTVGVAYNATVRVIGGVPPYTMAVAPSGATPPTMPAGTLLSGLTVSGTPVEGGNFYPRYLFTDSASTANTMNWGQGVFIAGVAGTSITVNNYSTIYAGLNQSLNFQLGACCAASYTWSLVSGTLPHNATLSAGGLLGGTPDVAGKYTFVVKAADSANASNFGTRQLVVEVTPLQVTTNTTLPFGNVNVLYASQTLAATGGTGALTWTLNANQHLPPGLALTSATGVISGTPTAAGQYAFSITVTDTAAHSRIVYFNMAVYPPSGLPPLVINNGSDLGTWAMGETQWQLMASGGNGSYTWSLVSGTLPPGMAIRTDKPSFFASNASAGLIGVATTPGNYSFTLGVTSGSLSVSQAFTVKVTGLNVRESNCFRLPEAFVGQTPPYAYTLGVLNNAAAATFTPTNNVPPGLTLAANGLLSGTPTQAGYYNFNYNLSDGVHTVNLCTALNVNLLQITSPGLLPNPTQNSAYTYTVTASGGTGPYTFSASSLPNGLSLNASTGVISGTITQGPGRYGFNLTVTDHNNVSYTKNMAFVPIGVPPTLPAFFTYGNFDDCTVGMSCQRVIGVNNGGTAPFTWNITGLPAGMTFRSAETPPQSGVSPTEVLLYGVPQTAGTYNVTVKMTDAANVEVTQVFPLTVSTMMIDGSDYLPNGTRGAAYSKLLRVIGGASTPTYTAQIAAGILPAGLSLSGMTVSGTPAENGGFGPFFTFTDTASSSTLHITEFFNISGGTSTITVNTYNFNVSGSVTNILGYYNVGSGVSFQIGACCVPSYTWSKTAGNLPPGVSFSSGGLLTGTATTAGTYTFTVQAADATNAANFGVRQVTVVVTPLVINNSSTLPFGNVGAVYSQTLTASSNATWTLSPGFFLPPGLTLTTGGVLSGTPTSTGNYGFYLKAVDGSNNVNIRFFNVSIYANGEFPPLFLGTGPILGPYVLGPRSNQLTASGGKPPYHYSYTPGAATIPGMRVQDGTPLPQGFTVANGTGGLIGVLAAAGTWNTSLRVTDANGVTYDRAVTLYSINLDILNPGNPPNPTLNVPYSFTFIGYGGTGTYTWSATNLPAGLTINSTTGTVSGTPTSSGTSTATITITDTNPISIGRNYTFTIDPFAITPGGVLPQGTIGVPYSVQLDAPGCGTGCTGSIVSGGLPGGLSFDPNTGMITGTPNSFSTSTFTVQASGSNGTVQKRFSLAVPFNTPQPLAITSSTIGTTIGFATVSNQYSLTLFAQGGTAPYTFSVASGSTLPPGLSIMTSGENIGSLFNPGYAYLAGRVMQAGTGTPTAFTFTLKVTDANNATATQTYTFLASDIGMDVSTWPIGNPGTGTYAATYPPLVYNTAYTQAQVALGGSSNYTSWTTPYLSNPLPPGLSMNATTGVITGTPTNTGSFSTIVQVSDDSGQTHQRFINFNVATGTAAAVNIGTGPSLGTYQVGNTNTFNLNPSGGTGPYTFTALSALPPGCALQTGSQLLNNTTASYLLSCSYLAAGSYTFTLKATDSVGNIGVRTMNISVMPFTLLSSTNLPNGSVGSPYSQQILASDNNAAVTWTVLSTSALPPGMTLTGSTLGGTPSQAGNYNFTLVASDGSVSTVASGATINYTFNLTISTIHITTPDIIPTQVITNVPYTFTFTATGGGTKTWSATGLPSGLSMSTAGALSGTTTATGTFRITVTVTDGSSTYTRPFTLFAHYFVPSVPSFNIFVTALADARVGQLVAYTLSPGGGVPPFTWTVASGSTLPPGLSLLSGSSLSAYSSTQTVGLTYLVGAPSAANPYTFDLIATDSTNIQMRRTFTLNVSPMTILGGNLRNATTGVAYSQQLTVVGGTAPYTFTYTQSALSTDMLPPGYTASASGLISGTTSSTGSFGFVATAHDSAGKTFTTTYSLIVANATGLFVSNAPLFGQRAGAPISLQMTVGGGSSTYSWSVSSGALPTGLSLVPSGGNTTFLIGVPSVPGTYNYTLRATDTANASNVADRAFTAVIQPMSLLVRRLNMNPPATVGAAYSYTYQLAGGTPPYAFAAVPLSPLPPGLNLNAGGVLSGTPTQIGNYSFTFKVTDANNNVGYVSPPSMNVLAAGQNNPPSGRAVSIEQASVGQPYAYQLDLLVSGGVGPFTWTLASGSTLPPGMTILPGTSTVSSYLGGIPMTVGTYTFSLNAADSAGQTATAIATLVVSYITASPQTFPNGSVGVPYSATFAPSGGAAPYSIDFPAGSALPPGLTLNPGGVLSGTPTVAGLFIVFVQITDANHNTLLTSRTIAIDNNLGQVQAISINPGIVQMSYVLGSTTPVPVPLSVAATDGAIAFNAMVRGIPGATLSATSGSAPTSLTLSLNTAGLTAGTYGGVIAISAPQTANAFTYTPVALTVLPAPSCTYSLDSNGVSIAANTAYSNSFNVITGGTCAWTVTTSDPSWITVSGGGTGGAPVNYTLAKNTSVNARTATINVIANGVTVQTFTVTEFGLSCSYAINPATVTGLSPAATSITVAVSVSAGGCPAWTATGLGAPAGSFTGNGSVTLNIPANAAGTPQTSTATIAGRTFSATQNPATCTVNLSTSAVQIPAAGSGASPYAVDVSILPGCTYTSSASTGVTVISGGSGSASGTLYYSVAPNSTTVGQSLAINIGDKTLAITLDPLPCSVTVDASSVSGTLPVGAGGPFAIGVHANGPNCSWTAASAVSWATVSPPSGTGNGTVNLTVTSNAGSTVARTTNPPLNIAGNNVAVTQAGTTCTWQLPSLVGTVPYSGGTGNASVVAPGACPWGSSTATPWLHISSSGTGGTSDVTFVADPNSTNTARTGTITITGASPTLTYTVTQGAAPCSFTLGTTSSGLVNSSGFVGSFTLTTGTAGCTPHPQSFAGWLHVTSTSFSGTSGTIGFSADANIYGATRTGLIKLEDGRTYTVTQSGSACSYGLNAFSAVFGTSGGTGAVQGSPSAGGCTPTVGTSQPSIVSIGTLTGPTLNIYTLPYTVAPFVSASAVSRKAYITFGGLQYAIKQTSW